MSDFLEQLRHFFKENWEIVYLILVGFFGATAGFTARMKLSKEHFEMKNWFIDVLLGTFTGWAAFAVAQELNLSANVTALSVGFSSALGLKAFQLGTFIFEKKVEEKLGIKQEGKKDDDK